NVTLVTQESMALQSDPLPRARNRGNLRLCLRSFIVPSARCRKSGASALGIAACARACSTRACAKTDITIAVPAAKPATCKPSTRPMSKASSEIPSVARDPYDQKNLVQPEDDLLR